MFDVYYMNAAGQFITLEAVRGNNRVWRQIRFAPITTSKIFIHVYNAKGYSRIVEVEAWEAPRLAKSATALPESNCWSFASLLDTVSTVTR